MYIISTCALRTVMPSRVVTRLKLASMCSICYNHQGIAIRNPLFQVTDEFLICISQPRRKIKVQQQYAASMNFKMSK